LQTRDRSSPQSLAVVTNVLILVFYGDLRPSFSAFISYVVYYHKVTFLTDVVITRQHRTIRLNCEDLRVLDYQIVEGYDKWVEEAPDNWKADGFITSNAPIIVTSCYGQNARIAIPGHEDEEAADWDLERDYSKIAYLTVALATSIKCAYDLVNGVSLS
jgi:hypothetical protein